MRNWDDALANMAYVPGSEALPEIWTGRAAGYRSARPSLRGDIAYGANPRHRLDLVLPDGSPKGLAVFVHGGYWMRFDKSFWTDLAEGARAHGWAVALPSYRLAPEARIGEITQDIGAAITAAAGLVQGPIRLMGHSAGGHLVSRMICDDSPLPAPVFDRIELTLPISGLFDLRPLLRTKMNETFKLTEAEAICESAALRRPRGEPRVTCWVGEAERPEFVRQSKLFATMWEGVDARIELVLDPGANHFTVVEGLKSPDSPIVAALLAGA